MQTDWSGWGREGGGSHTFPKSLHIVTKMSTNMRNSSISGTCFCQRERHFSYMLSKFYIYLTFTYRGILRSIVHIYSVRKYHQIIQQIRYTFNDPQKIYLTSTTCWLYYLTGVSHIQFWFLTPLVRNRHVESTSRSRKLLDQVDTVNSWWKMIWYDIFVNCNWVVTRWQYTFTHKQYIEQYKINNT